jgi:hypothetical protein
VLCQSNAMNPQSWHLLAVIRARTVPVPFRPVPPIPPTRPTNRAHPYSGRTVSAEKTYVLIWKCMGLILVSINFLSLIYHKYIVLCDSDLASFPLPCEPLFTYNIFDFRIAVRSGIRMPVSALRAACADVARVIGSGIPIHWVDFGQEPIDGHKYPQICELVFVLIWTSINNPAYKFRNSQQPERPYFEAGDQGGGIVLYGELTLDVTPTPSRRPSGCFGTTMPLGGLILVDPPSSVFWRYHLQNEEVLG